MRQIAQGIGIALAILMLGGCSSFNRDWKQAAVQTPPADDFSGRWEGSWQSEANGHNGELRCLVTKVNDSTYDARYRAKYKKILSFGYTVPLRVQKVGETYKFSGEADLGKLAGGVYRYDGIASPTNFTSTYASKYDHGYFRMARPETNAK